MNSRMSPEPAELSDCVPGPAPGASEVAASQPERDITQVYETHFRYVWRCLRSLGVRSEHLDDALQDVFIVVQRRLAEFDGKAQLSTWLYAIALRIARKYRVRARLTTELRLARRCARS